MKILIYLIFSIMMLVSIQQHASAKSSKTSTDDTITAIEVTNLLLTGSSYADISKLLSEKYGFDATSAHNRKYTDKQITRYLVTNTKKAGVSVKDNRYVVNKANGDTYFRKSDFAKAAKEYSLAIKYSKAVPDMHRLRGESYRQYLSAKNSTVFKNYTSPSKMQIYSNAKDLLCYAINSDYKMASKINADIMQANKSALDALKFEATNKKIMGQGEADVQPKYWNTTGNKLIMRKMDILYRSQRLAYQTQADIRKSMADYNVACGKEDASRKKSTRAEKDGSRDKKWVKYAEEGDIAYYYDNSNVTKSKGTLKASTRRENLSEDEGHEIVEMKINCKDKYLGISSTSTFDDLGAQISSRRFDKPEMTKVNSGTSEEMLLKKLCK